MRRLRHIRVGLALLAITLVIAQVLGASLAAAKAPSNSKSVVVICSVHGQMSMEVDLPGGAPSSPAKSNCPCCLIGCGQAGSLPPLSALVAYELGAPQLSRSPRPLLAEIARPQRTGGEPASPRAPPTA